jgi:hypothetical protein
LIVCIAEDRAGQDVPVKLLVLSLSRHSPQLPIYLIYPPATSSFIAWLENHPQVELCRQGLPNAYGWNVKPQAILHLLDAGHDDVAWIDSDIIITRDIGALFDELNDRTLLITEEALWGANRDAGSLRAELWGFPAGRALPFALNTSVVRATQKHRHVLKHWQEILQSADYRHAQQTSWRNRPLHMVGDQDVLTALLASKAYSDIPLKILRRGEDILQYFGLWGFTVPERAHNLLRSVPMFVHSQGHKPWIPDRPEDRKRNFKDYIGAIYLDLSPYILVARSYRNGLQESFNWMRPRFMLSRILRAVGLWYPPLVGLPIAIIADCFYARKRLATFLQLR